MAPTRLSKLVPLSTSHQSSGLFRILILSTVIVTSSKAQTTQPYLTTDSREKASLSELENRRKYIGGAIQQLPSFSMRSGSGPIGFRSKSSESEFEKEWIEIRLEQPAAIDQIVLVPTIWRSTTDDFGADGFPLDFRIQAGNDGDSLGNTIVSITENDKVLPRVAPLIIPIQAIRVSWIRIETERLSLRGIDNRAVLQLAEILIFSGQTNIALNQQVITSSSQGDHHPAWDKDHLVDGYMPYLINTSKGGKSLAYISSIVKDPNIVIDLGQEYPVSELHLHPVEQWDTVPQAHSGTLGIPYQLRVYGSTSSDFKNPSLLFEILSDGKTEYAPVIMHRFVETPMRYIKFEGLQGNNRLTTFSPEQAYMGFAEIEIYSREVNVAAGKTAFANHEPKSSGRSLTALTDGRNLYGEIPTIRDWLDSLAYRHELETELPLVIGELELRYANQKFRLFAMTWIVAICVALIGFVILLGRNLRMKQAQKIRLRIAANLHDELGANLHAIGLLGDHAINVVDSPDELMGTMRRIRSLTEETGAAARQCTNMLESGIEGNSFVMEMKRVASRMMADTDYELSIKGAEHMEHLKHRKRIDLMLFHKECLMNVIRHAEATSVRSTLSATPKMVRLEVTDNGCGLNPPNLIPPSLQRRAKLMRAKVVSDKAEGGGTRIHLSLRTGTFQSLL